MIDDRYAHARCFREWASFTHSAPGPLPRAERDGADRDRSHGRCLSLHAGGELGEAA